MNTATLTSIDSVKGMSLEDVLQGLACDTHGLAEEEAAARLEQFGRNTLEEKKENALLKFLHYFWGPIAWMIEIAAVLSAVTGDWMSFGIVFALLAFNGLIGFFEEHEASDAMESLRSQLSPKTKVLRSGEWKETDATLLVPGDVIQLKLGDIIPADCYLFEGDYLSVDQSALTGESLPVARQVSQSVYSGTVIKQGEMSGLVVTTGASTYFGRTAQLVEKAGAKSHFEQAVLRVGRFLIYIALGLSAILIAIQLVRGVSFLRLLAFVLILVVASIPVAMPAVLSVTMALGALALSRLKAIVTKLESIEEMAGINILCSDKTGTLTQNKLTPSSGVCFGNTDDASLMEAGALASRWENSDAIDAAVIAGMKSSGGSIEGYRQEEFVPFDPVSKRTEAAVSLNGNGYRVTKGAPQVIMDMCEMPAADRQHAEEAVDSLAAKGYRTLGVARTGTGGAWQFLGIIPLSDPPRTDSRDTIVSAHKHGINVKMVTGDNQAIAREISRTLGMGPDIQVATSLFGKDGNPIGDVGASVEKADGYAQVFPEHKYGIVKALQDHGHLVGMTGDGVNDAPALKQADVGVAVSGATGAAQAAADLVLTLPGLSVIIRAVEEARRIFSRMTSYTVYRIAMTIDIMIFVVAAMLAYNNYPLTAVMIVLLALLDDIPIMTIAYDNTFLSPAPVRWDMRRTLTVSVALGGFSVAQTFLMLLIGKYFGGLGLGQLQTLIFLQLVVGGHLMLFITRAHKSFWQRPYPSAPLFLAIVLTQILAVGLCAFGLLVPVLAWKWIGIVWAYNLLWMLPLNWIKLTSDWRLARSRSNHRRTAPATAGAAR